RLPFRTGTSAEEVWVYVLLEHQSEPVWWMPLRLLEYMVELWKSVRREWDDRGVAQGQRRLPPIIPAVFYTGTQGWSGPLRFADLFASGAELARFIPSWETLFLNLHHTPPEQLVQYATSVGYVLRVLREEKASRPAVEQALEEALAGLEGLPDAQDGAWL